MKLEDIARRVLFTASIALFATCNALAASLTAPLVLYTDIASGPNTGGENGNGAYLSIFGKNFGTAGLGTKTKVTIGGVEVASYRFIGVSKARPDVQQVSVQIGALTGVSVGTALPVRVSVDGVASNADVTFAVNPGRMLFVDNVNGNDATAVPGNIAKPYRHVQTSDTSQAAFGAMKPGDIIVMRGTGTTWTDHGDDSYFIKFIDNDGTAPTGSAGTGPLTLMAYPGEDVFIDAEPPQKGAISGIDTTGGYVGGHYVTIADLLVKSGGNSGVIAVQIAGDHWRIVNNDLSAATATNNALAGGINGNATNSFWYGNYIHDIAGGAAQENHGIYVDGDGSYDIAFNQIANVSGGNGFQIFADETDTANHVHFHHNLVHGVSKHGLNVAEGSQNDIELWNNIVYDAAYSGLRFNSESLHGAKIYNNTFYDVDAAGTNDNYAAMSNDAVVPTDAFDIRNNIFEPVSGKPYAGGSVGFGGSVGTLSNNLWFGGTGSVSFDSVPISGNPAFANAPGDLHLTAASAAIDQGTGATFALVANDYDAVVSRPVGADIDIGAYEFDAVYIYDRIFNDGFE
jgi:hypothetical protein